MTTGWTYRDLDIVESLTRRVRLLTAQDIARIWWPNSSSSRLRRRIRRLRQAGLIEQTRINAHATIEVTRPIVQWTPGRPEPSMESASMTIQRRWTEPAAPIMVFSATRLAANLWGSSAGRLPNRTHWDHDLLLARVYAHYRVAHPQVAQDWIGEDCLPKAGYRIKDPDAFLVNDEGRVTRVIESAGRYSLKQLETFHEHCADNHLPYELW